MKTFKFSVIFGITICAFEVFYALLDPTDDEFETSAAPLRLFAEVCEKSILPVQDWIIGVRTRNVVGFGIIDIGKAIAKSLRLEPSLTIECILVVSLFVFWCSVGALVFLAAKFLVKLRSNQV